jgi:mannose-6-phosphate isomerase
LSRSRRSPETLSPLWFAPVFRQYLWGGRRLGELLGKPIGPEPRYAESWEVVDHGPDQSVVAWGHAEARSLVGQSLNQVMADFGPAVVGPDWHAILNQETQPPQLRGRFPLLVKWLDAQQNLSLQVHPNDQQAAQLTPPDLGKSEAWYVADALPGAKVYAGLLPGVDQSTCQRAIQEGKLREILHSFEPQVGDCIYIPAGTIHAIGAGLLIAEVQQASDTTYRLYDWERVADDGRPRPLQIPQALAVTDWQRGPVNAVTAAPRPTDARPAQVEKSEPLAVPLDSERSTCEQLVESPYFSLQRWCVRGEVNLPVPTCQILIALSGSGQVQWREGYQTPVIRPGSTVLLPQSMATCRLRADTPLCFLLASLPAATSAVP